MKRTLLQVVQEYLDATSGFYVNSIFETDESQQVAKIAERVYYGMIQEYPNILFTMKDTNLDAVSDTARPNFLLIPKSIQKIQDSKIYYNVSTEEGLQYKEISYVTPTSFLELTSGKNSTSDNTEIVKGFDDNQMVVNNKQWPSFCTSFDNKYIVFDAYHSDYDSTMQASKSRVVASEENVFLQEDDFLIPVPEHLSETYINLFLEEALDLVYQQPNARISQKARRGRIKLQQDNRTLGQGKSKRSYGRRGGVNAYVPRGHGNG